MSPSARRSRAREAFERVEDLVNGAGRTGSRRAPESESGSGSGSGARFVNNDNTRVGFQAGVVHEANIYVALDDDEPDRRIEVAENCLAGDMPRRAEELLGELVASGRLADPRWRHLACRAAYRWTLAVLSDRPIGRLDDDRLRDVDAARTSALGGPDDEWRRALDVVYRLLARLLAEDRTGEHGPGVLDDVLAEFDRLPETRREEIHRHLDLLMSGVAQDRVDARRAALVRARRNGNGREARVWKFFEPVPAEPRPLDARPFEPGLFRWALAVCGTILAAAGLTVAFVMVVQMSTRAAITAGVLLLASAGLGCAFAPRQAPRRHSPFPARRPVDVPTPFSRHVAHRVEAEFDKRAPDGVVERSAWTLGTRQRRSTLATEVANLYAEPKVEAGAIDWLIAWHAKEAAREWSENGGRARLRRLPARLLTIAEIMMVTYAGLTLLTTASLYHPDIALVMLAWVLVGAVLAAFGRVDVLVVARLHAGRAEKAADRRLRAERRAYAERVALLRDRPTDGEMARWLDFDKIYLKSLAMNQYGLGSRDVLQHAFITEAAPAARRARVHRGPPRFSAYTVWVFLLTEAGVRQVSVHLDFPTGIAKDQHRRAFRYDALTAAEVVERGIRFDDGRRRPMLPQADGRAEPDRSSFIYDQLFRLTLGSGHQVDIRVEHLDAWLARDADRRADGGDDDLPPPGDTDLSGALGLLEAVAADGRDWIRQAKDRRRRRLRHEHDRPAPGGGPGSGRPRPGPNGAQAPGPRPAPDADPLGHGREIL
ncbi:hypothetical protein [Actinomadura sp. WAC 06369]|uniref:hypothetical protein n=1 Tax=Actinomadura sp. WAC 06369 TaxID=2203193 RepID=UPI000F7975B9|nr:hypothetical protein [Actinomadura sp. WAC 06369]RSN71575.1 hypothetical protein DMH08_02115 [Actinomadura sp. WAC 06369]